MDFELARERLFAQLGEEIRDRRVLEAMNRVPRENFVSLRLRGCAYEDRALGLGHGQTISQPLIVALMTEALLLTGVEKVLEIGTGSGYQTAVLAELAAEVISVERVAPLADAARERLTWLGYRNVTLHQAEKDKLGWVAGAPYDAIMVTAGAPRVPPELVAQLGIGGRLVIPVGERHLQRLLRVIRTPAGERQIDLGGCVFVPLIGEQAWPD